MATGTSRSGFGGNTNPCTSGANAAYAYNTPRQHQHQCLHQHPHPHQHPHQYQQPPALALTSAAQAAQQAADVAQAAALAAQQTANEALAAVAAAANGSGGSMQPNPNMSPDSTPLVGYGTVNAAQQYGQVGGTFLRRGAMVFSFFRLQKNLKCCGRLAPPCCG